MQQHEQGLYERSNEVIGKGAFSMVYRGKHKLTGSSVAIKVFTDTNESRFGHTVKCFERILCLSMKPPSSVLKSETSSLNGAAANASKWSPATSHQEQDLVSLRSAAAVSYKPSRETMHALKLSLISKELIVSMLDFSKNSEGKPGIENGEYFIVMELGDFSLEQYLEYRAKIRSPLSTEEIRSILHDVARVVCLLHAQGLAHLDIKPANIMLFNSTFWKLIDFDGCFLASSNVDVLDSDIAFTPLYCSPEIASVIVKFSNKLRVSRLMDVWSIGTIGAELVLLKPVFEDMFDKLYNYENQDDSDFLIWISTTVPNIHFPSIDTDLHELITERLLKKEPLERATLPDILQHPFFTKVSPIKKTWAIHESRGKVEPPFGRSVRTLNKSLILLDEDSPLESDDAAEFIHECRLEDCGLGLESSPETTPPMSPKSEKEVKQLYRVLCCGFNSQSR